MDSNAVILFSLGTASLAAVFVYMLSAGVRRLAFLWNVIDQPTGGRKIHAKPIPLFGGVGISLTVLVGIILLLFTGVLETERIHLLQWFGIVAGLLILLIGGMVDDVKNLRPSIQVLFPVMASFVVVLSGTSIVHVSSLSGSGAYSLSWWTTNVFIGNTPLHLSLPADVLTFLWLLVATYATKLLDGLDGLVTSLTVIGAGLVASLSLSAAYYLPSIAILSSLVGGAFAGFLPSNWNPAKQFLGESGSTMAGFLLGVLAILSGAKIAIALAVLVIPIMDVALVVAGRILQGKRWFQGDDTHLHFRLLRAGVPQKSAVIIYIFTAFIAGVLALSLQTQGKVFLILGLCVLTATVSYAAGRLGGRTKTSV